MEIQNKTVLVLGAGGMVGQAICRTLARKNPKNLILASLHEHETTSLVETLEKEFGKELPKITPVWGNTFVRHEWKDLSKQELLGDAKIRQQMIGDLVDPLTKESLHASEFYFLCTGHQPDIIIDTVNFASSLPHFDLLGSLRETVHAVKKAVSEKEMNESAVLSFEKFFLSQYTPQISKHIQVLIQTMIEAKTKLYLKTGNIGVGGAGFSIPFTHTDDWPPPHLLNLTALAGAHTLLLYMMSKIPGAPMIKEIKPAVAIAWKQVGFGPISYKGRAILLEDATLGDAVNLAGKLSKTLNRRPKHIKHSGEPKALTAPFIDLGENGLFALGEFKVLSDQGLLEFVTPEEISETVVAEIEGKNTGKEMIAALHHATIGSTYRAGYMREQAIERFKEMVNKMGIESVSFDFLGSPRLAKILYEAHLLKLAFGSFESVLGTEAKTISKKVENLVLENQELRSQIISIGLPILLSGGGKLLRGSKITIPADIAGKPDAQFDITETNINRWSFDGWVDLREINILKWQERLQKILKEVESIRTEDSSSANPKDKFYWNHLNGTTPIEISKLASWVLAHEGKG